MDTIRPTSARCERLEDRKVWTPAIVLAAGASRRMGAVKALLPLEDGVPAVCRLARLYELHCGLCLVVTGYHAEQVEAALVRGGHGLAVRNAAPERGQLSSLQCGLRAFESLTPEAEWFLFAPVDCFDTDDVLLTALRDAIRAAAAEVMLIVPEAAGRHGHPVAARRSLVPEFLALSAEDTARTVIDRYRHRTQYVSIGAAGSLADYDTPEEFGRRGGIRTASPTPSSAPGRPGQRDLPVQT